MKVTISQEVCCSCTVRTGPGKHRKSWNLIIWISGLESHGIFFLRVSFQLFYYLYCVLLCEDCHIIVSYLQFEV